MTNEDRINQLIVPDKEGIKIGGFLLRTGPAGTTPAPRSVEVLTGRIRSLVLGLVQECINDARGSAPTPAAADGEAAAEATAEPDAAPAGAPGQITEVQVAALLAKVAERLGKLFASSEPDTAIDVKTARAAAVEAVKLMDASALLEVMLAADAAPEQAAA